VENVLRTLGSETRQKNRLLTKGLQNNAAILSTLNTLNILTLKSRKVFDYLNIEFIIIQYDISEKDTIIKFYTLLKYRKGSFLKL